MGDTQRYCRTHGTYWDYPGMEEGCRRCRDVEDSAVEARRHSEYRAANPGDFECPHCRYTSLKAGASRCPLCRGDVTRDYWEETLATLRVAAERERNERQSIVESAVAKKRQRVTRRLIGAALLVGAAALLMGAAFLYSYSGEQTSQREVETLFLAHAYGEGRDRFIQVTHFTSSNSRRRGPSTYVVDVIYNLVLKKGRDEMRASRYLPASLWELTGDQPFDAGYVTRISARVTLVKTGSGWVLREVGDSSRTGGGVALRREPLAFSPDRDLRGKDVARQQRPESRAAAERERVKRKAKRIAEERAQKEQDAKDAAVARIVIGTWRDENSVATYEADGAYTMRGANGVTAKGRWSVSNDRIVIKYEEWKGQPNTATERYRVVSLAPSAMTLVGPRSGKEWHNIRVD